MDKIMKMIMKILKNFMKQQDPIKMI